MDARLAELGIELPALALPAGSFLPYVFSGNLLFLSGRGSPRRTLKPGETVPKVGSEISTKEAQAHAREAGLYLVALMKEALGSLDRVERIVKVTGLVNATEHFTEHTEVLNGCSELLLSIFGPSGQHSRTAFGVSSLPKGFAVEIEAIVRFDSNSRGGRPIQQPLPEQFQK